MPGFAPERLARIAPWLQTRVTAGLPGAVALVARDEECHVVAAGMSDVANALPMRRDTIFRIASMTKPMIAVLALTMIEEATIALDDPVTRWLPELADRRVLRELDGPIDDAVPAERAITVRDLLTLRCGIGAIMAAPDTYPIQRAMVALDVAPGPHRLPFGPDEYLRRLATLPLVHQPGVRWMYHSGIDILAVLLARVAGRPLARLLEERLFAPLGLADTGFYVPAEKIGRLATSYTKHGDDLVEWDMPADGKWAKPPAFPSEVVSTIDDYCSFCRMLLAGGIGPNGRILARASVALMMTDQITPAQKAASPFGPGFWDANGWGFGGAVVTARNDICANPGSYGWSGGLGTHFTIDPAEGLIAIMLTQKMMTGPDDGAIGRDLFTLAHAAFDDSDRETEDADDRR
jgi:CubicO group peptidase (beta-lactamase class C family)